MILAATSLAAQTPPSTSVTVFQDGRVLHRRVLPVAVPSGFSLHRLVLGTIEPGSVFALDSGVAVTGTRYDAAVSEASTLQRVVGRQIAFATTASYRDTIVATVLGVEPERFKLADGRVVFSRPGVPLFPAEWVLTEPTLVVGVRSASARTGLGLGFFSRGGSWQASYEIVLGRTGGARVAGQATITLGPLRVDSAEVQLLAGDVGRGRPGREREGLVSARMAQEVAAAAPGEQSIGEVHLYTLPGRLSLEPGVATSTMLFEPVPTTHERSFTLRGQIPFWGGLPQYGEEQRLPLQVTHIFRRALKTAFGDLPLPGGTARVYERDAQGRLQLVGEGSFAHLPAGQDLRLDAGTAFDLTAKRVQTEYSTRRDSSRTIALAAYKVTMANANDSVVTVEVLEERGGEWAVLSSSVPPERVSSTVTRFRVRVPARGQAILTYRVRVVW